MSENNQLPKGWEWKKLGDVLEIQNGYAFDSKLFSNNIGVQLIRIRDLKSGVTTVKKYNGEYDKKYLTFKGDLLIGMDGEFRCFEWKGEPSLLNQRVCRLENYNDAINKKFIMYGINKYLKEIEEVTSYATVKHISARQIKNINFPVPPLTEQKQIVQLLDKAFANIDRARANIERNIHNARELFQSKLNDIFSQQGEGWEEKKLGEVCENLDRQRIPITKSKRVSGEVPYYGASGVVDHVNEFIFDEDLLLVSEDGANLLTRTYPIAFSISGKTWVNNHAHVLRFSTMATQKFVEYYLNSIKLDEFISGMAQPKLNQRKLNSICGK